MERRLNKQIYELTDALLDMTRENAILRLEKKDLEEDLEKIRYREVELENRIFELNRALQRAEEMSYKRDRERN